MYKTILTIITLTLSLWSSKVEVSTIKPTKTTLPLTIEANGKVISQTEELITSKSNGIIHLLVSNNSEVKTGTKIAQISDERRERELKLLKSKQALLNREIETQQQKISIAKDKYKMGVGAKNDYLSEEIGLKQLQSQKKSLESEYQILLLQNKNAQIYASKNGFITNLIANNSYINYGSTIANITTKTSIVKLFVDIKYAKKLKKGMRVKLYSSYQDSQGVISDILFQSTNNLMEIMVKPNKTYPLNLQLQAKIVLSNQKGLLIPKKSIVLVNNHPAVYLVKEGVAHIKFIEILQDKIDTALVRDDFAGDEDIVVRNAYLLRDGVEVRKNET